MSERYCFYCGKRLELKEVCSCRNTAANSQRQQKTGSDGTESKNSSRTTARPEAWQRRLLHLSAKLRLAAKQLERKFVYIGRNLVDPLNAAFNLGEVKPLYTCLLAIFNACLLALNLYLFLHGASFGKILNVYLFPFTVVGTIFDDVRLFGKIALIGVLIFLCKTYLFRYFYADYRGKLDTLTTFRLQNPAQMYQLVGNLLALLFCRYAPIQFLLICSLTQALVFYSEIKAAVGIVCMQESQAFVRLCAVYFSLFVLLGLLLRALIPGLTAVNLL